ncbi:UDP-4-amino-4,6-dideoxy-N-acetyl-beta-L-altrosamine N-acetyltransferase [Hymenobacter nivis]|uniref:UDP-4-amino-4, 6-dideoxy-N-acetyl-beta-L-altrosamine N-acetyltransferase n=1 Tax=Hymenobacter nivis TaxID=1850093 RepID=A0A502GN19_9BACT|nr:UDP-4-amino-4,6-dideoxy-N-acetyl-beta-L-altrosamine N-acetyltransferase [Hymenobacter nivis]TPG63727.1 UDP-4-amino-4,6-dideoxy-N-acetyl-beta-L-altrosamine N-acetyltransferase [Hymenobacter nivis]
MPTNLLRPLTADDLELVRTWRNSEAVAQYMYTSAPVSAEQQQAWFARVVADASKEYWVIMHQGRPVGVANLYAINPDFRSCYWAFYLGDPDLRGSGLGARVEYAVLEHVFEERKLNKLLCEVFVSNDKVVALHEKFGFRRESYFRQHVYKNGTFHDVVGLALLRREWQLLREQLQARFVRG